MNDSHSRTGGQLVADSLKALGTDTVFCVPGESYLEVLDALYDERNVIRVISCRHENGASYMAEAYGKLTGKPGICMVTRGPGACNASIGIHTAFQDSTPMIMFIGQVARPHMGREAFQEVDYKQMFGPLAKAVDQIETPEDVAAAVAWAHETAISGRPGPVVLALPEDMLRESAAPTPLSPPVPAPRAPGMGEMERLHHVLGDCERPLMMLGGGGWTQKAKADIEAFAEDNALPVCCSFRRNDLFDNDHPNFVGEIGISANPSLLQRLQETDLLLVVGARLGEMTTQGYTMLDEPSPVQTLIHVHTDRDELGRVYHPDLAIHADLGPFAAAARALAPVDGGQWRQATEVARGEYLNNRIPDSFDGALDLGRVMAHVDDALGVDGIVAVDAGNFSGWPQRFIPLSGARRFLGPTNGAMGYAVPAALAAKAAEPGKTVMGFVGDGGFGMTGQEISTAVKDRLNAVILVFNNGMYGTIRMHQEMRHPDRPIATDLANPDYAALARAAGAFGATVEKTEQFAPTLAKALGSGLPAIIELRMDPEVISTRATLGALRGKGQKG